MVGCTRTPTVCAGCGARHKKFPTSWVHNNALAYCAPCWQMFECAGCKHHDPKGAAFRGRWQCRGCRHRHATKGPESVQEACHRMIIDDHLGELPPGTRCELPAGPAGGEAREARGEAEDEAAEDGERGDELAPLPSPAQVGSHRSKEELSHIVLLLDASGSMRTVDVEGREAVVDGPGPTCRLDAAVRCASDFVAAHARAHPNDIFSVATISDTTASICEATNSEGVRRAFEASAFRGAGGTFYQPALATAAKHLDSWPGAVGHVVVLSDGRPADTKAALSLFQELFVRGKHAAVKLHGIAFGATVESFAPLQQLACISGGSFVLSGCNMRSLCEAFTSISSSITSLKESSTSVQDATMHKRAARQVDFELPELGAFGKKGVLRFVAARSTFRYDGEAFHKQEWLGGEVERRSRPYMRGGMRLVYGFRDARVVAEGAGWMVAKASRFREPAFNTRAVVEAHAKSTAVARHFAALFNEQVRAAAAQLAATPPAVIFASCFVYAAEAGEEGGELGGPDEPRFFAAERYLPGAFLKYNSNNGYVNEGSLRHHDAVQAFLHFTFVKSGGGLLVADLQGVARQVEVLLTDPQVLTPSGGTFGPGDLGARGLRSCLAAHRCGATCRLLGLKPISGPLLRRLEVASAPRRRPGAAPHSSSSALSGGSWERLGSDAAGGTWERLSEHQLTDIALSEGCRSSQASASSWVHLLET